MASVNKKKTRIQLRRDTTENWSKNNPILLEGEQGLDITNDRIKIGDGETNWNELKYSTIGKSYNDINGEIFNDYENNIANGKYAHAEGQNTQSSGTASHAEGIKSQATSLGAHAEGNGTVASSPYAHAEGISTKSTNLAAHAEGHSSVAHGNYSHAEGYKTDVYGAAAHGEGNRSLTMCQCFLPQSEDVTKKTITLNSVKNITVGSKYIIYYTITPDNKTSTSIGGTITAVNNSTLTVTVSNPPQFEKNNITLPITKTSMIGCLIVNGGITGTNAISDDTLIISSHAEGSWTTAGLISHAEGLATKAQHIGAHSEGEYTIATGYCSHAEGSNSQASGTHSHAEGSLTTASGFTDHAEGANTEATGGMSHAEGNKTKASGSTSHAEGTQTVASGGHSHAEGVGSKATNNGSHAEGNTTEATAQWSHAEGDRTKATGQSSHTEGKLTSASREGAHAEGVRSSADGIGAHAEGNQTNATGEYSHAEGSSTSAESNCAHAEGANTTASGSMSHAEGNKSAATAEGAHAEGILTTASGYASHAEGRETIAAATYSHASGLGTKTNIDAQTAIGKYNKTSSNSLFIIGNGENDEKRSNAFEVTTDGYIKSNGIITKYNNVFPFDSGVPNESDTSKWLTSDTFYLGEYTKQEIKAVGFAGDSNRFVVETLKNYLSVGNNASDDKIGFIVDGKQYIENIESITKRTDGRYNIDFSHNQIKFSNASEILSKLSGTVIAFSQSYNWNSFISSDKVSTSNGTAADDISTLYNAVSQLQTKIEELFNKNSFFNLGVAGIIGWYPTTPYIYEGKAYADGKIYSTPLIYRGVVGKPPYGLQSDSNPNYTQEMTGAFNTGLTGKYYGWLSFKRKNWNESNNKWVDQNITFPDEFSGYIKNQSTGESSWFNTKHTSGSTLIYYTTDSITFTGQDSFAFSQLEFNSRGFGDAWPDFIEAMEIYIKLVKVSD